MPLPRPDRSLILLGAPAALLGVAFGLGKIVRDCSLTCNVGFELAPLAILAIAVATFPVAALRVRLEGRWGYLRWQVLSAVVVAVSLFAFRGLTYFLMAERQGVEAVGGDPAAWLEALRWAYLAFFVWVGVAIAALGANAYAHVGRVSPTVSPERALGVVAVSAVLGGILGSWLAQRATSFAIARFGWRFEVVRDNLMIGMGLVLLLLIPVVLTLSRQLGSARAEDPHGEARGVGLRTALRWIREDGRLRRMALLILAGGVADTVGKYLFYWLVSEQFKPDPASGRTLYFATFYGWLNGVSLLLLAFGTSRVIQRVGIVLALVSLPLALSLGAAFLTLNTVLIVMYGLRVVEGAMHSSLYDPALDRLHLGVPEARRQVVRPVLTGLLARAGEGLGAVAVLGLVFGFHASLRQMLWLYLATLLAWAGAVMSLRTPARDPLPDAERGLEIS